MTCFCLYFFVYLLIELLIFKKGLSSDFDHYMRPCDLEKNWILEDVYFIRFVAQNRSLLTLVETFSRLVEAKWWFQTTLNLELKVSSHVTYGIYDWLQFIKYITKNVFPGVWVCFRFYFRKLRLKKPHFRTKQSSQLQKIS